MAEINPLRYRGYYYDAETGFYYLQSRYYDPNTCRFINYIDSNGQEAAAIILTGAAYQAFASWLAAIASANWWNAIGWVAAAVLVTGVITVAAVYLYEWYMEETGGGGEGKETDPEPPDVTYPGNDPQKAPKGTEWRGKGEPGSKEGNYYNPQTGESWHPDLDHPEPIGPHWDYNSKGNTSKGWRVYPDKIIQKL